MIRRLPAIIVLLCACLHTECHPTTAVVTRDVDRLDVEDDRVIAFRARTDADIDGFGFEVLPGARALRFVLEIDGQARNAVVEKGRDHRRHDGNPFTVQRPRTASLSGGPRPG